MKSAITIEEAKKGEEYNRKIAIARHEAHINQAIDFINEIIGFNFYEIEKRTNDINIFNYYTMLFIHYTKEEMQQLADIYSKNGFIVQYYEQHKYLYIKLK
jgi:hypothetical protein